MTRRVHHTAVIDATAELGANVVVEPYAVIGPRVMLGDDTTVAARATLPRDVRVGSGCTVGVGAVVGADPQDLKYAGEPTSVEIGDRTTIREYVTINRGTVASGATVIGTDCYLMSYVHVAHDCRIGDGVILANAVQLGGHVTIDCRAQVGGATPIHQYARVGRYAFVGGWCRVAQDIPPFTVAAGQPLRLYGVNTAGLRRAGVDPGVRLALKHAYRLLFNSSLPRNLALERVRHESGHVAEVAHLIEFLCASQRGVPV